MDFIELSVETRKEKGKSAARKLRQAGLVPAVLYGNNSESLLLQIKSHDVFRLLQHGNRNAILKLTGLGQSQTAMIKEIQKEHTRDRLFHVDFLKVAMDTEIETVIPVELVEEAIGVIEGGVLQHNIRELPIKALPKDVPEKYELNISELAVGSSIKVSDLKEMPGVQILANEDENVVSVIPPTELKEEELAPEAAEGEEAEAAAEAGEGAAEEGSAEKKSEQ